MSHPLLLLHLLPRHPQSLRILHHHIVAAIRDRVEDGFVLALQEDGDLGGEAADGGTGGIEEVPPFTISQRCL